MLDYIIVLCYLLALMLIGIFAGKNMKDANEFAVPKKEYPMAFIAATMSATFMGGGFCAGNAASVFTSGVSNVAALTGFSICQVLIGLFVAPKVARFQNVHTAGDMMALCYGGKAKRLTGVFSVLISVGVLGAQLAAIGYLWQVFFGRPAYIGILVGGIVIVVYSTIGGLGSLVITDTVQFCILCVGIPLLVFMGLDSAGGAQGVTEAVPRSFFTLLPEEGLFPFLMLFLTFAFGEALTPPYLQRLLISKKPLKNGAATVVSGLISVPFFVLTGICGLLALTLSTTSNPNEAMPSLVAAVLPTGLKGLVIASMLAVYVSSADSFLNSAAVSIVSDVFYKEGKPGNLRVMRLSNFLIGAAAILSALYLPDIMGLLVISYNFWAPFVLVPLLYAILKPCYQPACFYSSVICAALFMAAFTAMNSPFGIPPMVAGLIGSYFGYQLVR
mgnify:CR=1 FL=1